MVVVILAVMWALVLLPPFLRSRTSGRPGDSVSSFGRQLSTLSRTAGRGARPMGAAYRTPPTRSSRTAPAYAPARQLRGPVASADRYDSYDNADDQYDDDRYEVRGHDMASRRSTSAYRGAPAYRAAPARRPAPAYRARMSRDAAKRRRQNVLMILGALAFATLALGLGVPGMGPLLVVHVGLDLVLVAYLALLVQLRRVEVQRSSRFAWSHAA